LAAGGLVVPQAGHREVNGVAHSIQNLRCASFSVPQFEQITKRRSYRWLGA
jgi:hypothetical protein